MRPGTDHKMKVLSLIDRETGRSRSVVVDDVSTATLMPIVLANVSREAALMTDDAKQYKKIGEHFATHDSTNHSAGEYVDSIRPWIHTNTVEGFFSVFKRGMKGVYQHCAEKNLNRYLAEFDFRYSNRAALGVNDTQRAERILSGVTGRRLTYQMSARQA